MTNISILTDNVAQIPVDIAQQYNIDVVHYPIIIEGKSYKDGIDIFPSDVYQRMRTEDFVPKTSQPSLGEFLEIMKRHLEQGVQSILYIIVSKTLSGAYSTASSAAHMLEQEYPGKRIVIFNSGTAAIAQGFLTLEVARAAHNGANLERLIQIAEEEKPKVGFAAMVETLKYLARGGRVGKAAYLVGNMINIKPIIMIDDEGVIAPLGNIRGEKKCCEKLLDIIDSHLGGKIPKKVAVIHSDVPEKAEQLKQLSQERFNLEDVLISDFTPIMGAHVGPGLLGLGYHLK